MPHVSALRDKVLVLCTFTAEGTQQALAAAMRIKARDLSVMIHGSNEGDVKEHVPAPKFKKFTAFICAHSRGRFSEAEAGAVLLAEFPLFVAFLFPLPITGLNAMLSADAQTLPVEAAIVKRAAFAIVDTPYEIPAHAVAITRRQGLRFRIDAVLGRQLIVLYQYWPQQRWMRLAPGPWHEGTVLTAPTLFPGPEAPPVSFSNPSPCYRFVFIEAALDGAPKLGDAAFVQVELDAAELAGFGALLSALGPGQWRWGQVFVAPREETPP